jgi:hypothetical protein
VLSRLDFPDERLPWELRYQSRFKNLTLLWTDDDIKSYKKFIPVRVTFPFADIVTVDDDIIYPKDFLFTLVSSARSTPHSIVGNRGRYVEYENSQLIPYQDWELANLPANRYTLLTGSGGIFYPPILNFDSIATDAISALEICPTSDDIWFWAAAIASNIPIICLCNNTLCDSFAQLDSPRLHSINSTSSGPNDLAFIRALHFFNISLY